ncbi:MAG TPA: hypothetical protein EYH05_08885, partial [Anaerolineae bacterium]|nr:hypothetical protein [Anaerolineae bacterium]
MKKSPISNLQSPNLPWKLTAVLFLILLFLIAAGQWRSTATGAQVQVPMFYDAHYLFPRPWTQEQAAPGVPAPAPLAFYGDNTVTQPFVSGADNLTMLEIWLAGEGVVEAAFSVQCSVFSVQCEGWSGEIVLDEGWGGGWYRLAAPKINEAEGQTFWLTLAAPEATAENPA